MKIYTEINYEWIDGEGLVEISSDSFDYEGEVTLCWGWKPPRISIPNPITVVTENLDAGLGAVTEGLSTGTEVLSEQTQLGGSTLDALQSGGQQLNTGLENTIGQAGNYLGDKIVKPIGEGINTGLSFMGYLGNKLSEFLYGSSKPSDVVVKNEKTAGGKDKQSAAELGTNKGQQRSRSSLKIS
jgi:hypothetical protein